MYAKVIRPPSRFFKVGQIVEMEATDRFGNFTLDTGKIKQSFPPSYHTHIKIIGFEEFAGNLIEKLEREN